MQGTVGQSVDTQWLTDVLQGAIGDSRRERLLGRFAVHDRPKNRFSFADDNNAQAGTVDSIVASLRVHFQVPRVLQFVMSGFLACNHDPQCACDVLLQQGMARPSLFSIV